MQPVIDCFKGRVGDWGWENSRGLSRVREEDITKRQKKVLVNVTGPSGFVRQRLSGRETSCIFATGGSNVIRARSLAKLGT